MVLSGRSIPWKDRDSIGRNPTNWCCVGHLNRRVNRHLVGFAFHAHHRIVPAWSFVTALIPLASPYQDLIGFHSSTARILQTNRERINNPSFLVKTHSPTAFGALNRCHCELRLANCGYYLRTPVLLQARLLLKLVEAHPCQERDTSENA
jgi:hypothetical protein